MEIGIYSFAETSFDPTTGRQFDVGRRLQDLLEEIELADEVGLDSVGRAVTICLECNQRLRDRPKVSVREVVPAYVFRTQEAFKDCPACGRVYWKGTHWARMRRVMADVAPDRQGAPQ